MWEPCFNINALTESWTSTCTVERPLGEGWWCHPGGERIQLEQSCQCAVFGVSRRSGILLLWWQKLHDQWRPSEALVSHKHFEKPSLWNGSTFYLCFFQVAEDNYKALLSFFDKFPNFTQNEFFIFGESYGGFYVPTLSLRVVAGTAKIKFKVSCFIRGSESRTCLSLPQAFKAALCWQ